MPYPLRQGEKDARPSLPRKEMIVKGDSILAKDELGLAQNLYDLSIINNARFQLGCIKRFNI